MTIHYDEIEDQYWIAGPDSPLYFDSILEAQNAEREIFYRKAVEDQIAAWLRAAGYNQIATAIEAGEYKETNNA